MTFQVNSIPLKMKTKIQPLLRLGIFIYLLILIAVVISNFASLGLNWPFGLFASFMTYWIFAAPFAIGISVWVWRRILPVLALFMIAGFYPFFSFNQYQNPQATDCETANCLSLISVNLHHDMAALKRLSLRSKTVDADLVLLVDLPYDLNEGTLSALYPNHPTVQIYNQTEYDLPLGSALAVLSKRPVEDLELVEDGLGNTHYNLRGILRFSYSGLLSKPIKVYVIHPMMPVPPAGMGYRDQLLQKAISEIGSSQNFILLGDFNITPWESGFKKLPGIRAGDPRWISTWDAERPWLRLVIDHVMIGENFEVVTADVMPSIGSDHNAIYTVVRDKAVAVQ